MPMKNPRDYLSRLYGLTSNDWYKIKAADDVAEVFIYDAIDIFGVDAEMFVRDLKQITAPKIRVRLNTPGGSVFDGMAIFNALKSHGAEIETQIDGLAASMGSVIALAGDTVKMSENAFYMIHDPFGIAVGTAEEMRKTADLLDKVGDQITSIYAKKTGLELSELGEMMDAETWFTAEEALDAGFIDEITNKVEVNNRFDLSAFLHPPEALREEAPERERGLEKALREAGLSRSKAKAMVVKAKEQFCQRDADNDLKKLAQSWASTRLN